MAKAKKSHKVTLVGVANRMDSLGLELSAVRNMVRSMGDVASELGVRMSKLENPKLATEDLPRWKLLHPREGISDVFRLLRGCEIFDLPASTTYVQAQLVMDAMNGDTT